MSNSIRLFISSASRTYGTISNFNTILPKELFEWDDQYDYGELSLVNFSAKMSYYNISSTRNSQFYYNDGVGGNKLITLPDGNYSVIELATLLTTKINLQATGIVWTVAINLNTLKYSFSYTGTPTSTPVFTAILSSFLILGFNGTSKTVSTGTNSDKIVSIGNVASVYIHMSYVGAQNKVMEHPEHGHEDNLDNVFAKVNIIGTSFFGTIYYERGFYKYSVKIPNSSATEVNISLRDKEGNIIEFSEDYDMVLELETKSKKVFSLENLGQLLATQLLK